MKRNHLCIALATLLSAACMAADTPEQASARWSYRVLLPAAQAARIPEAVTVADLAKAEIPPGTVITGACFDCETPDTELFPATMTEVTFRRCNLNNVAMPGGNTAEPTCTIVRHLTIDGDEWVVDGDNQPLRKMGEPEE